MRLLNDTRLGLRLLTKDKSYTLAALLTLALCIGGNAAIFSMLSALVLRPLPFTEPERIVEVYNTYPKAGLDKAASNVPILVDYSQNTSAFAALALVTGFSANIGEEGSPERIEGIRATPRFLDVLGVAPALGAFFTDDHTIQGQHQVAVLTERYWRTRYDADPNVAGARIQMNEESYEILGVAPRAIEAIYPEAQVIVAFAWSPEQVANMSRHGNGPRLFGRLQPETSTAEAKSQIDARDRIFYDENPATRDFLDRAGHVSQIGGLQQERIRNIASTLYLLQGGALFVLAIGCVNIANLLLIRSNARRTEFAIRAAIGASPMDGGRQLLVESLLLSAGGAALGAVLGIGGIALINTYAMDMLPPMQPLALDGNTLLFALALAIATGLLVGLFPIVHLFSVNQVAALSHASRGASSSRASRFAGSALVCGQVSLALMLLVGAGLLIHSFTKILTRDLGFDATNVTTVRLSLSGERYREPERVHALQTQLLDAIRALPGVEAAGIAVNVPMTTGYPYNTFSIFGYTMAEGEQQLAANRTWVSPGYFDSLGIRLLEGEVFGPTDVADARRGVVIDKTLADRYYPGESPIGRRLGFVGPQTPADQWPEVIGVVEAVQHTRIDDIQGAPFIYQNLYGAPFRDFSVFIKSGQSQTVLLPVVRERLKAIDPYLPLFLSGSLADYVDDSLNNRRAIMLLLAVFAGIAVTLSSIGIYGVMAYSVSQQTREIGTRAALGADRRQIMGLFLKRGVVKALIGLAIGIAGTLVVSRFLSSMLYEVEPTDPLVYASLTALLFAVCVLASFLPALKASRIHPMEALRLD